MSRDIGRAVGRPFIIASPMQLHGPMPYTYPEPPQVHRTLTFPATPGFFVLDEELTVRRGTFLEAWRLENGDWLVIVRDNLTRTPHAYTVARRQEERQLFPAIWP